MAYISTVYPKRKNVVIMVDHGNSLSANQLNTAKGIVKYILGTLSQEDRVSGDRGWKMDGREMG